MARFVIAREDTDTIKWGIYHHLDVVYKKYGSRRIAIPKPGAVPVCGNLSRKDGPTQHLKILEERYGYDNGIS